MRVANIYDIDKKTYLLKLSKPPNKASHSLFLALSLFFLSLSLPPPSLSLSLARSLSLSCYSAVEATCYNRAQNVLELTVGAMDSSVEEGGSG